MRSHKCVSCGSETEGKGIIFGICRTCQDYIVEKRVDEIGEKGRMIMREQAYKLADEERRIEKLRSELKAEKAAVELVLLIKSIK